MNTKTIFRCNQIFIKKIPSFSSFVNNQNGVPCVTAQITWKHKNHQICDTYSDNQMLKPWITCSVYSIWYLYLWFSQINACTMKCFSTIYISVLWFLSIADVTIVCKQLVPKIFVKFEQTYSSNLQAYTINWILLRMQP